MSDIQQYLLDYDKSRKEASAVAQQSATRKLPRDAHEGGIMLIVG
jgi:hypothetical protein